MKSENTFAPVSRPWTAACMALVLWSLLALSARAATPAAAAQAQAFDTPQEAADALVKAAEADDVPALLKIFGPAGKPLVSTGDAVRDKKDLAKFASNAREKMSVSFDIGDPKRAVLVVGDGDWPLPVPIVEKGGKWRFDAKEGRQELVARRIGSNELDAISLLRGYVEAQKDYASELHDGSSMKQYAQKWLSSPGKQDGLSWYDADGKPAGPMGDEIAKALAAGYTKKTEPYNGYHFRTLFAQGPAARLGARNYIVHGMMIGGFAAIAWPATYGVTGVQTFIVNNDGAVYQKDLGPDTATIAPKIKKFNPDKGWVVTEDEE
jgi:Protein of unknown function (DUF2950)